MPISINGSGTISGISVGGLENGCVNEADLANAAVTPDKLSTGGPRWDTSGRLLVGTSSSIRGSQLQVLSTGNDHESLVGGNQIAQLELCRSSNSAGGAGIVASGDIIGRIECLGNDGSAYRSAARIEAVVDGTPGANDMPGRIVLSTTSDGASSPTERMRITSGGDVLFNTTGIPNGTSIYGAAFEPSSNNRVVFKTASSVTTAGSLCAFYNPNGLVGTISVSASATAYNTSSDYRLKENVTPVSDGITRLQQLKPSRFNFIADPDTTVDGFLAHEVQDVVPEAVTGEKDAVDADGNPEYQGIDQSKLVPLLTAALQEAITRIGTLEAEVAILKGGTN